MGRAAGRRSASVRYQSSSCSCRTMGNIANICVAVWGASRQSRPPKVTWETCCPAPKQSKTAQPGNPRSRRSAWMPQRKSARRCRHGCPASLSIAKSADAVNGSATQHNPKQLAQSAWRRGRPPRAEGVGLATTHTRNGGGVEVGRLCADGHDGHDQRQDGEHCGDLEG